MENPPTGKGGSRGERGALLYLSKGGLKVRNRGGHSKARPCGGEKK